MIPVTRPFVATACYALALCTVSAAARAEEPTPAQAPTVQEGPVAAAEKPLAASVPHDAPSATPPEVGPAGAAVAGAGLGFAVAVPATALVWGAGFFLHGFVPGPGRDFWAVYSVVAVTTPVLLVVLPALGAGLASRAVARLGADEEGAATVGVAAGLGTAGMAAVGGVAGLVLVGTVGWALTDGTFGQSAQMSAMTFGAPAALIGAGVGAMIGAAVGAAGGVTHLPVTDEQ